MERFRKGDRFPATSETVEDGLAVTHEQVEDVYYAGTSDGIVFLGEGRVRDLKQGRTVSYTH